MLTRKYFDYSVVAVDAVAARLEHESVGMSFGRCIQACICAFIQTARF
jgi:hypothetical protein